MILFDCQFNNVEWKFSQEELAKVLKHFQDEWLSHQTKANLVKSMIDHSFQSYQDKFKNMQENSAEKPGNKCIRTLNEPYTSLQGNSQSRVHIKFQERRKVKTLESRVDHYVKKRRLDSDVYEKINEANNLAQAYNIYKPNKISDESDVVKNDQTTNDKTT